MGSTSRFVMQILDALAILGALAGAYFVFLAFTAQSSPTAAATAAVGIGLAVIPYCLSALAHRELMRSHLLKRGDHE